MSSCIVNPNLPRGKVTALICGGLNKVVSDFFCDRGIKILLTEENRRVDPAVSRHCDLFSLYLGNGKMIVDRHQEKMAEKLKDDGFEVIKTFKAVEGSYPGDCIINHTVIGKYIIGNSKIFDRALKDQCTDFYVIHTNQGYCKCSVLVIDERSVITDDESIALNCLKNGFDCLLISKGDILLEGHEYGFIGGASGKISSDEVVFFGDIAKHRDYSRIQKFIQERGMKIISFDFPLSDFGGIIPIKENIL